MPASAPNTMPKQDAQDAHAAYHLHRAQLTPQMRGVLERMARAGRPPLHRLTPQAARAAYAAGDTLAAVNTILARAAGVEIYRGVTHEFIKMGRVLPEARQAHADAARALRRAFEGN